MLLEIPIMLKMIKLILPLMVSQPLVAGNRLIIDDNDKMDFECKVELEENVTKFYFIDEVNRYKDGLEWNKDAASAMEYSWLIFLDKQYETNGVIYSGVDFGLRYFSRDAEKENGDLAALIRRSELGAYGYNEASFMPINIGNDSLNAVIENEDIVLTLNRKPETAFIFDNYPRYIHFWVIADGEIPRKCLARICKPK
jgi:hypothetical protein